ncbi:unnamed protein product [Acanthoscelides obtectus]|uniref:Uncharacterized protein n=1 Tax=Acanthoscelides obtectus TaxID=200917 RepID=A0A9P0LBM2_ACAOB|nr:unnamed protein product [Acanthoscelides obtectus]CAK1624527.1 hypothetical protein AOBTE_LOCUS2590 [Acanthoscelides obtectus]
MCLSTFNAHFRAPTFFVCFLLTNIIILIMLNVIVHTVRTF